MLKKIIFEIETITPMFLAGADQGKAEIRAASIKGLLRFWWRALQAESNLDELRETESEIFGSSDEKVGCSKFSIRIINRVNPRSNQFSPVPHSNRRFKFTGIESHQKFSLIITYKEDSNLYSNITETSLLLGGLGRRCRRGFGSVHCSKWDFKNTEDLHKTILDKINQINNDFESRNGGICRSSQSNAAYPCIKEISFGAKEKDVNTLLRKIGQASHDNRDPSLGYAGRHNNNITIRMASPIYVHIIKVDGGFVPVITTLSSVFPLAYPNKNLKKQHDFISDIMS